MMIILGHATNGTEMGGLAKGPYLAVCKMSPWQFRAGICFIFYFLNRILIFYIYYFPRSVAFCSSSALVQQTYSLG